MAEACVQIGTDQKVSKFKKHKDEYEDRTRGATSRYPLEIEAFFERQGME